MKENEEILKAVPQMRTDFSVLCQVCEQNNDKGSSLLFRLGLKKLNSQQFGAIELFIVFSEGLKENILKLGAFWLCLDKKG